MTSKNLQNRGISSVGLTSKQALIKLRSDIEEELEKYQVNIVLYILFPFIKYNRKIS